MADFHCLFQEKGDPSMDATMSELTVKVRPQTHFFHFFDALSIVKSDFQTSKFPSAWLVTFSSEKVIKEHWFGDPTYLTSKVEKLKSLRKRYDSVKVELDSNTRKAADMKTAWEKEIEPDFQAQVSPCD